MVIVIDVENIYYVHGKGSVLPDDDKVEKIEIRSTQELLDTMTELTGSNDIFAIIHSMAVSDYTTSSFMSLEEMLRILAESGCETMDDVKEAMREGDFRTKYTKLPSSIEDPVILLRQTPKVLSGLRDMAPDAVIMGFKLLDGVSHEELMSVAKAQIEKNDTDFCLANDYETVLSPVHVGFLLDREGNEQKFEGKESIAKGITEAVMELRRK